MKSPFERRGRPGMAESYRNQQAPVYGNGADSFRPADANAEGMT